MPQASSGPQVLVAAAGALQQPLKPAAGVLSAQSSCLPFQMMEEEEETFLRLTPFSELDPRVVLNLLFGSKGETKKYDVTELVECIAKHGWFNPTTNEPFDASQRLTIVAHAQGLMAIPALATRELRWHLGAIAAEQAAPMAEQVLFYLTTLWADLDQIEQGYGSDHEVAVQVAMAEFRQQYDALPIRQRNLLNRLCPSHHGLNMEQVFERVNQGDCRVDHLRQALVAIMQLIEDKALTETCPFERGDLQRG